MSDNKRGRDNQISFQGFYTFLLCLSVKCLDGTRYNSALVVLKCKCKNILAYNENEILRRHRFYTEQNKLSYLS